MLSQKEPGDRSGGDEVNDRLPTGHLSANGSELKRLLYSIEVLQRSAHGSEEFWRGYRIALDTVKNLANDTPNY